MENLKPRWLHCLRQKKACLYQWNQYKKNDRCHRSIKDGQVVGMVGEFDRVESNIFNFSPGCAHERGGSVLDI